jgi:hypothetical protein
MKLFVKTILICILLFTVVTWTAQNQKSLNKLPTSASLVDVKTPAPRINQQPITKKVIDSLGIPITTSTATGDIPPCLQMYYSIEKHAADNGIPLRYAYGIAYLESGYEGPFDWDYNHALGVEGSSVGPMQIIPQFAQHYVPERKITNREMKHDIDLNVMVSMRILKKLKEMHGDWLLVFGAYNTGRPLINNYARRVYNFIPKFKINEKTI